MTQLRNLDRTSLVAITLLLITIVSSIGGYWFVHGELDLLKVITDFYANISAELGSIAITVLVIDRINNERAINAEKKRLINQMGSPNNAFALEATRILRLEKWLTDGTLHGKDFSMADLREAVLDNADLRGAWLSGANLNDAKLIDADLYDAWLSEADLTAANLPRANLQKANLRGAKLHGAQLSGAWLEGAMLERADLQNANLRLAKFDETTILPDGTNWANDIDLTKFGAVV
jgi:uncharacterized protein YjbI with pentapeptide repeats